MNLAHMFKNPDKRYSAAAFWFWNGELKSEKLLWQMDQMADKGVYNAFMHARAYLVTPYLGEEWFSVVDACVRHAREIGFYPWLYDEYAWPSGTAGSTFSYNDQIPSRILAKGECNMAKGLDVCKKPVHGPKTLHLKEIRDEAPLAAYVVDAGGAYVRADINKSVDIPAGEYTVMAFYRRVYPKAVDYMNRQTIREFLDTTHEEYKARYGDEFGKTIPGIFFDEIYMIGHPLPWTDTLAAAFQAENGYDLLDHLPALMQGEGEKAKKIRVDYYAMLAALYEDAFFKQIGDWCEENNLLLTGHTEEGLKEQPRRQGNFFTTMRHLQIPGADCHDYRYRLPREISYHEPKYAVSVARAYNKPVAMSEAMGGAGWGCSLQEYRRGVNVLGAMGISMFTLHGFYNDAEHQGSQADWPASFFFQNPYWKYFKVFGDYMHRVSYMNTVGRACVDVGLYYPIDEICAHTVSGEPDGCARAIDTQFHEALSSLLCRQIDTDMIDEKSLAKAKVEDGRLCIGSQRFRALVCPASALLSAESVKALTAFIKAGGTVLWYASEAGEQPPANLYSAGLFEAGSVPENLIKIFTPDVQVADGDGDKLYVNHRQMDGADIYMVANAKPEKRRVKLWLNTLGNAHRMDPETGETHPLDSVNEDGRTLVTLRLKADEACYVVIGDVADTAKAPQEPTASELVLGKWDFLPLDKSFDERFEAQPSPLQTNMEIPVATFTSAAIGQAQSIRIRNTAWEKGACGRHLSQWEGAWLARRIGWVDNASAADLYFRKDFMVHGKVQSAEICAAAVNEMTVYVNGTEAAHIVSNREPHCVDIAAFLKEGENLLAIHVHNETPLEGANVAEAEAIPAEAPTSLLVQGEIITAEGMQKLLSDSTWAVAQAVEADWLYAKADIQPQPVDATTCRGFHLRHIKPSDWLYAWERGRPPMQPWGDLKLFGKETPYPQTVYYSITLPNGTCSVLPPEVSGECLYRLDGLPVCFKKGALAVKADGRTHQMQLEVTVKSPADGLKDNIHVTIVPHAIPLGDWCKEGLEWFSGRGRYAIRQTLEKKAHSRYWLDLGDVRFNAEVWVNGKLCGTRIWAPYMVEVTDAVKEGMNEIVVIAANSAACERRHLLVDEGMALGWNRYWNEDNMDREPQHYVSGLQGPVWLKFK